MTWWRSSREGRWPILIAAFGAAMLLVLLVGLQSPARADNVEEPSANNVSSIALDPEAEPDSDFPGFDEEDVSGQIVGGTAVPDGKYPFMAYLALYDHNNNYAGSCGGSLIDADSVLTAAHCLEGVGKVYAYVGGTVLSSQTGWQARTATAGWIDPRYNSDINMAYDWGVLKLNQPVVGIKPVTLSNKSQNFLEKPSTLLTVAGWGATSEGAPTTDRMREVSLPVVSDKSAKKAYASLPSWWGMKYSTKHMVAAAAPGQDSCQGDSGGPLFAASGSVQVGIVSYGHGCARPGFPGAYTEVNEKTIQNWILYTASL